MKESKIKAEEQAAGAESEIRNRKPSHDGDRYPEETVIDALLETDEGDEISPPEEDIFALPVLPRDEKEFGPDR